MPAATKHNRSCPACHDPKMTSACSIMTDAGWYSIQLPGPLRCWRQCSHHPSITHCIASAAIVQLCPKMYKYVLGFAIDMTRPRVKIPLKCLQIHQLESSIGITKKTHDVTAQAPVHGDHVRPAAARCISPCASLTMSTWCSCQHCSGSCTTSANTSQCSIVMTTLSISVTVCRKSARSKNEWHTHQSCSTIWWPRSTTEWRTCSHAVHTIKMSPSCSWCRTFSTRTSTWERSVLVKIPRNNSKFAHLAKQLHPHILSLCTGRLRGCNKRCCSTLEENRMKIWDWEQMFSQANIRCVRAKMLKSLRNSLKASYVEKYVRSSEWSNRRRMCQNESTDATDPTYNEEGHADVQKRETHLHERLRQVPDQVLCRVHPRCL